MSKETNEVKSISINTEGTAFAICLTKGIVAYDLYPLKRKFDIVFERDIYLMSEIEVAAVELISNTSFVAIAYNKPGKDFSIVDVYDVHNAMFVSQRGLSELVTCMKVLYDSDDPGSSKLCVGFSTRVIVYDIHKEAELMSIPCTPRSLSISALNKVLVTEDNKETVIVRNFCGEVQRRALNRNDNSVITAVSKSGRMVATASRKGTVIKVIDLEEPAAPMLEHRRGTANEATVSSMSFSQDDKLLAISTKNRETIHIFSLSPWSQQSSWWNPGAPTSVIQIHPPVSNPPNSPDAIKFEGAVVTFCGDSKLVVITHRGDYLVYEINLKEKKAVLEEGTRPVNICLLDI